MGWRQGGRGGSRPAAGLATFRDRPPELARGSRNAELLDATAEGAGIQAEDRGGAAGAGDDPVGVPEDLDDVIALDGLQARQGLAGGLLGRRGERRGAGALWPGSFC